MSNEELAVAVQSGAVELLLELWTGVRRLAWSKMKRWSWAGQAAGMEPEDFEQTAFVALLLAVNSYRADGGAKFSTWYCLKLQGEVFNAAGLHGEKAQRDPLRAALSLDAPASADPDEGNLRLADRIVDPEAEAPFLVSDCEAAIAEALEELPEEQRAIIRAKYWGNEPVDDKAHAAALRASGILGAHDD